MQIPHTVLLQDDDEVSQQRVGLSKTMKTDCIRIDKAISMNTDFIGKPSYLTEILRHSTQLIPSNFTIHGIHLQI